MTFYMQYIYMDLGNIFLEFGNNLLRHYPNQTILYMREKPNVHTLFMNPTDPGEIAKIVGSCKSKKKVLAMMELA